MISDEVKMNVVSNTSTGSFGECRRMITGPGVNEHPPYRGCTGFVGWEDVALLKNGELICTFSAGYWHVSFPQPVDIEPETMKSWGGFRTDVDAPTGGRALITRSKDLGKTWSQPVTLVDTPGDDRHPCVTQLADGTLVCQFFVIDNWYGYKAPPPGRNKNSRVATIRSTDNGKTWSEPIFVPSPFKYYDRMCSKIAILPGGSLLMSTYGMDEWGKPTELGVYRSDDKAKSWRFVSRLKGVIKEIDEPAICVAADGSIVMVARPDGEIAFSYDEGETWTRPKGSGIKVVAPALFKLKDNTIVCVFGCLETGGVQTMWSDDNGHTWTIPAVGRGFVLDSSVYDYVSGCELPDGSIYVVYYDPNGDQTKTAIWGLRFKIRPDRQGIDILPADGVSGAAPAEPASKAKPRNELDADAK